MVGRSSQDLGTAAAAAAGACSDQQEFGSATPIRTVRLLDKPNGLDRLILPLLRVRRLLSIGGRLPQRHIGLDVRKIQLRRALAAEFASRGQDLHRLL